MANPMAVLRLMPRAPMSSPPENVTAILPMFTQSWFHQELAALRKLERIIWPRGPVCPHCGATDRIGAVTGKGARPGLKFCCHCRKQFRATIATIFEGSHVPLHKWLQTCLLLTASEGGISAHHLHRHLGVTYKTALGMVRRLEPLVGAAMWEMRALPSSDRSDGRTAPAERRRIRWRRRRSGVAGMHHLEAALGADDENLPWVYPDQPADTAFRSFTAMAAEMSCIGDEDTFDELLRRIARPAPVPQPL
jgi:transposase-like protein